MATLAELLERWDSPEGHPYKGELIDWAAYEADPTNIGCMCAQGQVLHLVAGWEPERISEVEQDEADAEVANLLNISRAHAILLRSINDKADGAPSIVLTDPGKVIGSEWSKLLDFWWHMDQMNDSDWDGARDVAGYAVGAAAWAAARDVAGHASWTAARDAARDAACAWAAAGDAAGYACDEIQGAHLLRERGKPSFFLPLFGFANPEAIPARPADYGQPA